jgi:hypothetical protein
VAGTLTLCTTADIVGALISGPPSNTLLIWSEEFYIIEGKAQKSCAFNLATEEVRVADESTEGKALDTSPPEGYVKSRPDGKAGLIYLPPIHRLKMPQTQTQTAKVRWLHGLGYEVKEISNGLNVRYQQVRNMVTTIPKRAAREDLPPFKIELLEMEDVVEMLLGEELERTHIEANKASKRQARAERRAEEVAAADEDAFGNESLDDEGYGER